MVLAGAAVAAFAVYDLLAFQARRDDIACLLAAAHPLERSSPPALQALLRTEHADLAMSSSRELLAALLPVQHGSTLRRQAEWEVWTLLVRIHLGEDEQMAILCSRTFLGNRARGFQAGALSVYSRGLDQLTERELAALVVIARAPTRYRQPERAEVLSTAADALLQRTRQVKDRATSE